MARTGRPVEVIVIPATDKKPAVIGTKYTDNRGGYGVCAKVYIEDNFLYIRDNSYNDSLMIDVAVLPALIKELQRLQRKELKNVCF